MAKRFNVEIYTDGSCLKNPGPGGYCAILKYNQHEKVIVGREKETTNNRMELLAVVKALEALNSRCNVELYSDSQYVLRGISEWLSSWVAKDFRNVKNSDLWIRYLEAAEPHRVKTNWVKGHNGHVENERCDSLAHEQATIAKGELSDGT